MNNIPFTTSEVIQVKCYFPEARQTNGRSISLGRLNDKRNSTIEYRLYKYRDGYRVRRIIKSWDYEYNGVRKGSNYAYTTPYQLFRDSRRNIWPAFSTIYQVARRIQTFYASSVSQDFSPINV